MPNRLPLVPRELDARPLLRRAVAPGHVRIGPIMAAPSVLADLGVAPTPLLAEFDLDLATFTDPEHRVPFRAVAQLFDRCVEATSCHHFGLLVGSRAGLSSLGVVGYLASSAPNVGTALEILRQVNSVADGGGVVTFDCREHIVSLGYDVVEPGIRHTEQLAAAAIAIGFNILRALCGPQWQPHDVQFSFAAPRALAPYRKVFSLTPRFDQERSAIAFPDRWLANSPPGADPILHRMIEGSDRRTPAGRCGRRGRPRAPTAAGDGDDAPTVGRGRGGDRAHLHTDTEAPAGRRRHDFPPVARRGAVRVGVPAAAQHDDSHRPDCLDRGLFGEQFVQSCVQALGRRPPRRVAARVIGLVASNGPAPASTTTAESALQGGPIARTTSRVRTSNEDGERTRGIGRFLEHGGVLLLRNLEHSSPLFRLSYPTPLGRRNPRGSRILYQGSDAIRQVNQESLVDQMKSDSGFATVAGVELTMLDSCAASTRQLVSTASRGSSRKSAPRPARACCRGRQTPTRIRRSADLATCSIWRDRRGRATRCKGSCNVPGRHCRSIRPSGRS